MKVYIRAMGTPRSEIRHELTHASGELTEHLIKVYLYPNAQERNHWKTEIYSFLPRCPKLKSTNKFPESEFILECISAYLDQLEEMMYFVIDENNEIDPERYNAEELENMVVQYFSWLAEQLSARGNVHSKSVYGKLDEIGF